MSGAGVWDMRDTRDSAPGDPTMGSGHFRMRGMAIVAPRVPDRGGSRYPRGETGRNSRVHRHRMKIGQSRQKCCGSSLIWYPCFGSLWLSSFMACPELPNYMYVSQNSLSQFTVNALSFPYCSYESVQFKVSSTCHP